jgi:hypothetical protein
MAVARRPVAIRQLMRILSWRGRLRVRMSLMGMSARAKSKNIMKPVKFVQLGTGMESDRSQHTGACPPPLRSYCVGPALKARNWLPIESQRMANSEGYHYVTNTYQELNPNDEVQRNPPEETTTQAKQTNRNRDPDQAYGNIPLYFCCQEKFHCYLLAVLRYVVAVTAISVGSCSSNNDIASKRKYLYQSTSHLRVDDDLDLL